MNPPLPPTPEGSPWRRWLPGLILVAAGWLVYANSFNQTLVLDDLPAIRKNAGIRTLWPLSAALNPPPGPISFCTRPILNLTMAWDFAHARGSLDSFRRTNLLLHILCGVSLFALLSRLLRRGVKPESAALWTDSACLPSWLRASLPDGAALVAWVTALVWMAHPLNTAAVNYLSQRGELFVMLFFCLLLYALDRAAEPATSGPRWAWPVLAVGACLLGMGSKETMLAAPALALLYDRIFLAASWREVLRRRGVLHLVLWLTALWPVHRHLMYSPHVQPHLWKEHSHWHYLLTQCRGLVRMLRLAFWPRPLVFFYGMTLVTDPSAVWMQGMVLLLLLAATGAALRFAPRAGFAGAVFFGLLAPSSTLVPVLGQPIAEHRMYGPLAALLALVVAAIYGRLPRRQGPLALALAGVALAAVLGRAAVLRNEDYASPLRLWADTVRKIPDSPEPHNDYANALSDAGENKRAIEEYQEALRLKPDYVDPRINMALALVRLNRHDEAVPVLQEARRLKPDSVQIPHNLAAVYEDQRRYDEALPYLEDVLRLNPGDGATYARLARALSLTGRAAEALARLESALEQYPDNVELHNALGAQLCQMNRTEEALPHFEAVLASPAATPRVRLNYARALKQLGRHEEAAVELNRVRLEAPGLLSEPAP